MFRPSLGLFESSWRFWEPKCWNAQFLPLTWPWPDTWPFKKIFKSALEPSRRDLSNAASPVSLRSLVWELAWGGVIRPPPPRSMAFGWDPGQARVKPLALLPLHWLVKTATATSDTFSNSQNRYALLRYSAIVTATPYPIKGSGRGEAGGTAAPQVKFFGGQESSFSRTGIQKESQGKQLRLVRTDILGFYEY